METDEYTPARARFEHAARAIEDDDLRLLVLLKDYDVTRLPPRTQRASHFLDCERNGAHALIEDLATATKGLARGTIPHVLLDELKYSNQEVLFRIDELFKDSGVSAAVIKAGNTETRFINFVKGVSGGDESITPEAYRLRIDNFVDKLKTDFREILAAIAAYERKRPSTCDKDPPRPAKKKRQTDLMTIRQTMKSGFDAVQRNLAIAQDSLGRQIKESAAENTHNIGRKIFNAKDEILVRIPDDGTHTDIKKEMVARAQRCLRENNGRQTVSAICRSIVEDFKGIPGAYTSINSLRRQLDRKLV